MIVFSYVFCYILLYWKTTNNSYLADSTYLINIFSCGLLCALKCMMNEFWAQESPLYIALYIVYWTLQHYIQNSQILDKTYSKLANYVQFILQLYFNFFQIYFPNSSYHSDHYNFIQVIQDLFIYTFFVQNILLAAILDPYVCIITVIRHTYTFACM